jgi:hypothetical protein
MTEEHLPEAEAEIGNGYGHIEAHPEDHQREANNVADDDECANDFHGVHDIEGMMGRGAGLLADAWRCAAVLTGDGSVFGAAQEGAAEAEAELGEGFGLGEDEPEKDGEDDDAVEGDDGDSDDVHGTHS